MNFESLEKGRLDRALTEIETQYSEMSGASDFVSLIDAIDEQLDQIDLTVDDFITIQGKKHQQELSNVEYARTKLNYTKRNVSTLTDKFGAASNLGSSLTIKVKALDDEISKVSEKLKYVEGVQLLKTTIDKASYAIEHGQYEKGAQCIAVILQQIDPELVTGQFAQAVVPSTDIPELPADVIAKWIDQLTKVFVERFEKAATSRNVADLTQYFQLFPLIGKDDVGLSCYSKFICQIITDTSKNLLTILDNPNTHDKPGVYSQILVSFFESISQMLSQHAPLIKRHYGDAMPVVVSKIQGEIDSQIGIIGDTFYDNRRVEKALSDIKHYNFPLLTKRQRELHSTDDNLPPVEPQMDLIPLTTVGDLMTEFSTIFNHWALYCRFINTKYLSESTSNPLDRSKFVTKISQIYLPAYEQLYQYFFRRSLEKAITIEELPQLDPLLQLAAPVRSGDVPVSSVIEDVTLILNTTLRGCLTTSLTSTTKKFTQMAYQTLTTDLINGFFIKNLNDNAPRYNQGLYLVAEETSATPAVSRSATPEPGMGFLRGASTALTSVYSSTALAVNQATTTANPHQTVTSNNHKITNFVTYLNTLAMAQEYFTKVVGNVINELPKYFSNAKDEEMMRFALKDDFLDPFCNTAGKIISDSLVNLYNQAIKNRLLTLVNEFFPEQAPQLEDDGIAAIKFEKFTTTWEGLISPYSRILHPQLIFGKLSRLLVVNLSNIIEKKLVTNLRKFHINDSGALRLERDMSHLINQVCHDNYYLREKFVRVTQIILLVGMDDEEYKESISHINEEGEFDEALGINWVLTPQERSEYREYRR
ncbi:conserved oligomeric Golgi complex subunit 4 [Diutina catenulata]